MFKIKWKNLAAQDLKQHKGALKLSELQEEHARVALQWQVSEQANLASLSGVHGNSSIGQQILQLKRLNQIGVPHHAPVLDANILKGCNTLIDVLAAILQRLLGPEDCSIRLQHTI